MKNTIRTIYIISDKQDEEFIRNHEKLIFSALEKDIATVCRKTTVKVFPSIGK